MFKTSFIITEKNNQDLNKIVEIAKNKTNTSISKTSLINTAIAYFIENATNTNTGLSTEENILEVLKCYHLL